MDVNKTTDFQCPESRLLLFANEVYTPLLCIFGAVGNCLSILVFFTASSHRTLTSSYYLSALAVSDTGFLLNLFALWLSAVQGLDVVATPFSCPLVMYSGQVTGFLSVWFVVAFTVERFFAVCYPLTRPTVCTISRARKVIVGLTLLAVSLFFYVLLIAEVVSVSQFLTDDGVECTPDPGLWNSTIPVPIEENVTCWEHVIMVCSVRSEYHTFSQIANYVDTVFTLLLPFCVISFLNFRITLCVWKLKGQRETIVALSKLNRTQGQGSMSSTKPKTNVSVISTQRMDGNHSVKRYSSVNQSLRKSKDPTSVEQSIMRSTYTTAEVRVTKTLLLVSTVFLVFNLPAHAIRVVIFLKTLLEVPIGCEWLSAQEWANLLFNTNFGVNFLLYCVSGRNFRKSLLKKFHCTTSDFEGGMRRRPLNMKPWWDITGRRGTQQMPTLIPQRTGNQVVLIKPEKPSNQSTELVSKTNQSACCPTSQTEADTCI